MPHLPLQLVCLLLHVKFFPLPFQGWCVSITRGLKNCTIQLQLETPKTRIVRLTLKQESTLYIIGIRASIKKKGQLFKEMPCEIDMLVQHNHSIGSAVSLKYRKPSREVQDTLTSLFNKRHSPATALDCMKTEIQLNCEDYSLVVADRSRCLDYHFCYSLYTKIFKKSMGQWSSMKRTLLQWMSIITRR